MATILDGLYASYDILNSSEKSVDEKSGAYQLLLQGIKDGSIPEKRLSAKFLVQFSPDFPSYRDELYNLLVDLCDLDEENVDAANLNQLPMLHNEAILALRLFCSHYKDFVPKVTSIIVQMMAQCNDHKVQLSLQKQLHEVFDQNSQAAVEGILRTIKRTLSVTEEGDCDQRYEEREHACHVLTTELKRLGSEGSGGSHVPPAIEELIQRELMSVMEAVTEKDYALFLSVFAQLSNMSTLSARTKLIDTMTTKLLTTYPSLNLSDSDCVNSFNMCIERVLPLLSKNIFMRRLLDIIFPRVKQLSQICMNGGDSSIRVSDSSIHLTLLRHFAVLSNHAGPVVLPGSTSNSSEDVEVGAVKKCNLQLKVLIKSIKEGLPAPQISSEAPSEGDISNEPALQPAFDSPFWNILECLLLSLYQLAGKCWPSLWKLDPPVPSEAESACVLWSKLKSHLQYSALWCQKLARETTFEASSTEHKNTLENVQVLIRELIRPDNKIYHRIDLVSPSWNPPVSTFSANIPVISKLESEFTNKRPSAFSGSVSGKQARFSTQLYRPSGKYEDSLGSIPEMTSANQRFGSNASRGFGNRRRPWKRFK